MLKPRNVFQTRWNYTNTVFALYTVFRFMFAHVSVFTAPGLFQSVLKAIPRTIKAFKLHLLLDLCRRLYTKFIKKAFV